MVIGIDASRANQRERTGTEWYAYQVIRRLPAELPEAKVRLYLREQPLDDFSDWPDNVDIRVLSWRLGFLWSHLRLSWEMLWHRPDVLFVPANTIPIIHPKRTITTIHDVAFERFPELYRGRSVQRKLGWLRPLIHLAVRIITLGRYSASERDYHRWSSRQAVRASQTILTVSEFSKQEIVHFLHADPARIVVTHLGLTPPTLPTDAAARRARLGLTQPYLFFVGRLEKKKNIDGLIHAYQRYLQQTTKPLDLLVIGQPGFGWDELHSTVQPLMNEEHLHVFPWMATEDLSAVRAGASFLWFVTRYEGFGLPPLEAMAAGIPVMASRAGALPEVLGSAAVYVDPDDHGAMVQQFDRLATDQALRQQVVATGLQRASQFTWADTTSITAREIRRLADLPVQ